MNPGLKRFKELDALFSRLTESNIPHFAGDVQLRQRLQNTLSAATRAKWSIYIHWQNQHFAIVNEESGAVSQDDLPLTPEALRIAEQCAMLAAPAEEAPTNTPAPMVSEAPPTPMNKADDYWTIGFEAAAHILSARVERTGGFLSYGMYPAYPEGYFAYRRNGRLKPETALFYGEKHISAKDEVHIFPWKQLQQFLDALQNDERLLVS